MLTNYYILIIVLDILQTCSILKLVQDLKYQPFLLTEYRRIFVCNRTFIYFILFFLKWKWKNCSACIRYILYTVSAISSSRGSSQCRVWSPVSCISCTGRQILYHWATWESFLPHANSIHRFSFEHSPSKLIAKFTPGESF